jgi:phosphoserine phosphatase RsbU/P
VEEPFPSGCFPVGLLPEATFAACCFALQPGDTLVLYSDGVTEAANAAEDLFGVERLRELLFAQDKAPLELLQTSILSAVAAFSHGVAQADDITLLLARFEGSARP